MSAKCQPNVNHMLAKSQQHVNHISANCKPNVLKVGHLNASQIPSIFKPQIMMPTCQLCISRRLAAYQPLLSNMSDL
jgi:hypothetical protein